MTAKTPYFRFGRYTTALMLVFALAFVLNGCSSSPPKRRNIKLSEASAAAAQKSGKITKKEPEKKKELKDESRGDDSIDVEVRPLDGDKTKKEETQKKADDSIDVNVRPAGVAAEPAPVGVGIDNDPPRQTVAPANTGGPLRPHLGLVLGGGSLKGDQIDGFGVFGIVAGMDFVDDRWFRVDISGLYITTNRTEDNNLASGLTKEFELAADLTVRYYFTPHHTFMGLYALAGGRWGYLFWDYKNDIVITDSGQTETISSDRITYGALFLGLGANLVQTSRIHIGANLTAGYKIYSNYTAEGFENDIFGNEPMVQLTFDISFMGEA